MNFFFILYSRMVEFSVFLTYLSKEFISLVFGRYSILESKKYIFSKNIILLSSLILDIL